MAEKSAFNPHITDDFSPLQVLIFDALEEFGEMQPGTVAGDVARMFLRFANKVVEQVRQHPYWSDPLDYYVSINDVRPIPDAIMVAGLLMHYSIQQRSDKSQAYRPLFFETLNSVLWNRLNGNTPIRMRVVDGGSSPRYDERTNKVNGLVE